MRILIIKTSSLGDVIHALPVLDYLKQTCPDCSIDWVVEEPFLPIVAHNPLIDRVLVVRTKTWRKQPFAPETRQQAAQLWATLRQSRYDYVFDIQGNLKSGLIALATGAPVRIGFSREALQEKINLLFTTRTVAFQSGDTHCRQRYLRLVSAPFGPQGETDHFTTDIVSAPEDEAAAEQFMAPLSGSRVLLFQVGTTWATKFWHTAGWNALTRRILEQYPDTRILINWGSPVEKALGEDIIAAAGDRVSLLPWFKIKELVPIIRRVDLVVGGDTGPVYLAAAVGTPTVSYYRATSAATYAPRGEQHRSIQAPLSCTGCGRTTCERDEECRQSISVDSLFAAVVALLAQTPGRKDVPCCPS